MAKKVIQGWALYINIMKRIVAVFIAQALSILGAGSLVGIDVYQSALLAGIMGVAHVVEMLARKYIDDGRLDLDEVNEVFNAVPTRK
jgi:hypothetical protein